MKGLLDLVAILSGVFGLAALMFSSTTMTPESAPLYTARTVIVIAFVVIPFFMARAIEKFHAQPAVNDFPPMQARKQRNLKELQQLESQQGEMSYFDYFFQPGSGQEWASTSRNTSSMRNVTDGGD
jgi:hypothetical protein